MQKTRAADESFRLHFSSVLKRRGALSQCNTRLRHLHLLYDIEVYQLLYDIEVYQLLYDIEVYVSKNNKTRVFYVLCSDETWVFGQSKRAPGPIYIVKKTGYTILELRM